MNSLDARRWQISPTSRRVQVGAAAQGAADSLDYTFDWSRWLPKGDRIFQSWWSADAPLANDAWQGARQVRIYEGGLTLTKEEIITASTVWVSGGEAGRTYALTNRIQTEGGRVAEKLLRLTVTE